MRLLDLFCCQGGAGVGYARAGFDVIGVDIAPQPRNPHPMIVADAMALPVEFIRMFDAVHASPPCQAYTQAQRIQKRDHPDFIGPLREKLKLAGIPYVIENVPGSPLEPSRTVMLCGSMFGLKVYRHRKFECSFPAWAPPHPPHTAPQVKMGRPVRQGDFIQVVGNFSNVAYARQAMGIDWMSRDGLRESIPPAYTEHLGNQMIAHLTACQDIAA